MTAHLTLESASPTVLELVAEYAHGLGYLVDRPATATGPAIRVQLPDSGDLLLDLISHIGLSAAKAGVPVDEPLCKVVFRHGNAKAEVTMALRLAEFAITSTETAVAAAPQPG